MNRNQIFVKGLGEFEDKSEKVPIITYQILLRSSILSGGIPLTLGKVLNSFLQCLENHKELIKHFLEENNQEVLTALLEFFKHLIQIAIKLRKFDYLSLVMLVLFCIYYLDHGQQNYSKTCRLNTQNTCRSSITIDEMPWDSLYISPISQSDILSNLLILFFIGCD